VDGREVGYLGVLPGPALNQLADIRFVEDQKRAFLLIGAVMVLLAAAVAFFLAGAMTRRLREIARGARALAAGRYDTRVALHSSDELGQLALAFNDLGTALKQAEKSRQQWVVDISHELRTPLSTLRAELEALQDGVRVLDAGAVDTLHADVRRLERLVDDLYDLARSDLGALSYHKREVRPVAILEADLAALSGEFAQREIRVDREGLAGVGVRVHADPDRLSQLFRNLLTNTLRYTDSGGVLRVHARRAAQGLVIDFDDSAPGVPAGELEHLFDRFHRVERSRNRALGGAGLGLAICRNIAAAHGGTIDAQHSELGGLRVRLILPEAP
jgi:two-component system sensor histidine kinase BaeS